jgi:hypothetical protein
LLALVGLAWGAVLFAFLVLGVFNLRWAVRAKPR